MAPVIRKNVLTLTTEERAKYVKGVKQLKAEGIYDKEYVNVHLDTTLVDPNPAHEGPAFLPWHREFIRRFEKHLQQVLGDASYGLPYWDWASDEIFQGSVNRDVWAEDFMGFRGGPTENSTQVRKPVPNGPFAQGRWKLADGESSLVRILGNDSLTFKLPSQKDVAEALAFTTYDTDPWDTTSKNSFRNKLEGFGIINSPQLHNRVHKWVGGSMIPMSSPDDPIFFLHHCNVDRIWATWQIQFPDQYLPVSGGPPGHNFNDPMPPWNSGSDIVRPADVLDHGKLGYAYANQDPLDNTIVSLQWLGNRPDSPVFLQGHQDSGAITLGRFGEEGTRWKVRHIESDEFTLQCVFPNRTSFAMLTYTIDEREEVFLVIDQPPVGLVSIRWELRPLDNGPNPAVGIVAADNKSIKPDTFLSSDVTGDIKFSQGAESPTAQWRVVI